MGERAAAGTNLEANGQATVAAEDVDGLDADALAGGDDAHGDPAAFELAAYHGGPLPVEVHPTRETTQHHVAETSLYALGELLNELPGNPLVQSHCSVRAPQPTLVVRGRTLQDAMWEPRQGRMIGCALSWHTERAAYVIKGRKRHARIDLSVKKPCRCLIERWRRCRRRVELREDECRLRHRPLV